MTRQSVGPKPDSRPRLEWVHYKYLTKLLTPSQPFLTLQSHIHLHKSLTKLLPSWASALVLLTKGLSTWSQSRLDPCQKEQNRTIIQSWCWWWWWWWWWWWLWLDVHGDDNTNVVPAVSDICWSSSDRLLVSQDTVCSRTVIAGSSDISLLTSNH